MRKIVISIFFVALLITVSVLNKPLKVNGMPYYDLTPKSLVLRSSFSTDYTRSSEQRKHNIELAVRSINKSFVDVGGEFSFNKKVGDRTEKRGYQNAKIIKDGEFIEGVGGGVCQVSTTLYNAWLLAGVKVMEYHPHSLAVSYVMPSFDAMVNSGSADLVVKNTTKNPIIIYAFCRDDKIVVNIYGEPLKEKIERESVKVEEIDYKEQVLYDEKGEIEDLPFGEKRVLSYGKKGIKSEGYLVYKYNGKTVRKKIRTDRYSPVNYRVIIGAKK